MSADSADGDAYKRSDRKREKLPWAEADWEWNYAAHDPHVVVRVERLPCRPDRLLANAHPGLLGRPVGLALVAGHASQHAVLPTRHTTLRSRQHVVDRQFLAAGLRTAVLAGVVVPLEHVAAAEGHRAQREPVVAGQGHHLRHPQTEPNRLDELLALARLQPRPVHPGVKLEVLRVHHAGRLVPEQDQGPLHGRYVDRLPVAVQDQRRLLKYLGDHRDLLQQGCPGRVELPPSPFTASRAVTATPRTPCVLLSAPRPGLEPGTSR